MDDFFEFLAGMDLIDPIEGVISTFLHADWAGAYERRGVFSYLTELVACFTRHNSPIVWVQRGADWNGVEVERRLADYGVTVYGRGFAGNAICFRVKRRQARWAEYLTERAGIPVVSAPIDAWHIQWAKNARETRGAKPPHRVRSRWSAGREMVSTFLVGGAGLLVVLLLAQWLLR